MRHVLRSSWRHDSELAKVYAGLTGTQADLDGRLIRHVSRIKTGLYIAGFLGAFYVHTGMERGRNDDEKELRLHKSFDSATPHRKLEHDLCSDSCGSIRAERSSKESCEDSVLVSWGSAQGQSSLYCKKPHQSSHTSESSTDVSYTQLHLDRGLFLVLGCGEGGRWVLLTQSF